MTETREQLDDLKKDLDKNGFLVRQLTGQKLQGESEVFAGV
jgi:hypothetical protein